MLPLNPSDIDIQKKSSFQLVNYINQFLLIPETNLEQNDFYLNCTDELFRRGIDCSAMGNPEVVKKVPAYRYFLHRNKLYQERVYGEYLGVLLHFKDGKQWEFVVRVVYVDEPYVSIAGIQTISPILLVIRHPHQQTQIDATGMKHYLMAGFNDEGKFTSLTMLHNDTEAPYAVLSQARSAIMNLEGWDMIQWDYYEIWEKGMENRGYTPPDPPVPKS